MIARDITERKRTEEVLREAQKMESLGLLAGGVAHDFNNLLGAILGHTTLAMRSLPAESRARAHLEKAAVAVDRAADLTRQMLAYSGRGNFQIKATDVNALVSENIHLFGGAAIPKHVQLRAELGPDVPLIQADVGQLQQVLMNLIINAAEAIGPHPGVITITTRRFEVRELDALSGWSEPPCAGVYVLLQVRDTGRGMDAETARRIFDPFFTTKKTGRGLGLAAVAGILRGHHGAVRVVSEVGQGTTFWLLFPACSAKAEPAPVRAARMRTGPTTVLVVDDDAMLREAITDLLDAEGMKVLGAGDGDQAVEVFKSHAEEIDVVLLDLSMPKVGGRDAFQRLRELSPRLNVILMSGYDSVEATRELVGQGLAGFVQKPFTQRSLLEEIARLLG
jgi:two-component system cell cycle sensor histidine kinase/response regulator CckA